MAKSDITTLAKNIGGTQAEALQLDKIYDDVLNDLSNRGFWTETRIIDRNADGVTYTKASDVNRILMVSYDDRVLAKANLQELATFGRDWRDHVGTPQRYTFDNEDSGTFRIHPKPFEAAGDNSFPTGSPEGLDFPKYAVSTICTYRPLEVQGWLELPMALLILHKEFSRESNHTDKAFAGLCDQLGQLMLTIT